MDITYLYSVLGYTPNSFRRIVGQQIHDFRKRWGKNPTYLLLGQRETAFFWAFMAENDHIHKLNNGLNNDHLAQDIRKMQYMGLKIQTATQSSSLFVRGPQQKKAKITFKAFDTAASYEKYRKLSGLSP